MIISEHISYKEAVYSPTAERLGIDNIPDFEQLHKMQLLATQIFEPLRRHFNVPIKINSFFRCKELNAAVGGSSSSQHTKGEAIDIDDTFGKIKNSDIFYWIVENLYFDQIIWEFGNSKSPAWVHVSYKYTINRKKITISYKNNGVTKYKHFDNIEELNKFKKEIYNIK